MEKNLDAYLAHTLKKWILQQQPPATGRGRLLRQAACLKRRSAEAIVPNIIQFRASTSPVSLHWPQRDFNWATALWIGNEVVDSGLLWSESIPMRV